MRLDNSYDGLTQWDTGRKIILESYEICDQIHFSNKTFGKTIDVLVYKVEDSYLADIPDELLQSPSPITVYCYIVRDDGETTTISETFPVRKRNKPTDYIYNPESQTRIKEFNEFVDETITEMKDIETKVSESTKHQPIIQNGTWFIWDVVNNVYTDTGVFAQGPKGDKGDTGEQGLQGPKGDKGDTPVKGIDYFTNEDIESLGIDGKADKSSTLSGYGITDAYTKTETDGKLDTKVDKESGKGLSANDYTNTDKAKVDNLPDDTQSELGTKANSADLVNYVKNTDIATASELGIVKFNASFGISVNANGQPFINKAPQSVIDNRAENPSASYYPIVPSNFDYAASKSTHQDMSDNYDVSTLQVSESFEGNQGQLPVSYDASKGYIDAKFNDSTPITTASGYPLTITDHLEGEDVINYQVYGNSTQATRSGKNILPYPYSDTTKTISGITFTDNGDGTITASGTATDDVKFYCRSATDKITISSGTYTMSGCPNGGSATTYYIGGFSYNEFSSGQTFTVTDTTSDWFYIMIKSGATVNNLIFKPQIEVGTTATEYEQYGVMPSPDYPSEIQSVGNLVTDETSEYYGKYDVPVTVMGKNLCTSQQAFYSELTDYGYTNTTLDDRNCVRFIDCVNVRNSPIEFEENTQYTVQFYCKVVLKGTDTNTEPDNVFTFFYTDGTSSKININANQRGTWIKKTLTSTAEKTIKYIGISTTNYVCYCYIDMDTFQLEKGSSVTEYEPYTSETKHIYLNEPLRKVGDYADYVDYENQKVVRQIKKLILDGTETWYKGTTMTNTLAFYIKPNDILTVSNRYSILCNKFVVKSSGVSSIDKESSQQTGVNVYVKINKSRLDGETIDNFKIWVSNNNLEIYYVLATLIEEPITVPELTAPNSAVMNVSSGTVISPSSMDLTYYQDINKKLDEIHEDISNTQSELSTKANSTDLVNYVKFTDYASADKAGVIGVNGSRGVSIATDHMIYIVQASTDKINKRTDLYSPIVPSNLDYAVRSVYPITQTALVNPITVNTIYDLGLQTALTITLPSGQLGDFIEFDFISGTTATTLSVSSSNGIIGYDLIPEANNIYTLYFDWGVIACNTAGVQTYGWRCNYFEYAITLSEPSST